MESRRLSAVLALACLAVTAACGNKLQTREAVERGIRKGVQQRGLNLDSMDVRVESVNFHDNKADATVAFAPKGGQLSAGLTMRYTLEQRENEWVIVGRSQADMHQHSGGMQMAPQSGGMQPGGIPPGVPLPPGHPPASGTPK